MIPTVPFDLIFSVFVGLVFAACARVQFADGGTPWGRELAAVLSFEAHHRLAGGALFLSRASRLELDVLVDPARLPWGVSVAGAARLRGDAARRLPRRLGARARAQGEVPLRRAAPSSASGCIVFLIVAAGASRTPAPSTSTTPATRSRSARASSAGRWRPTATGVAIAVVLVGFTLWEQGKRSRS